MISLFKYHFCFFIKLHVAQYSQGLFLNDNNVKMLNFILIVVILLLKVAFSDLFPLKCDIQLCLLMALY